MKPRNVAARASTVDSQKIAVSTPPLHSWSVLPPVGRGIVRVHPWQRTSLQRSGTSKGIPPTTNTKTKSRCYRTPGAVTNTGSIGSGGGGGAGRATFQDLSIVHKIDRASPQLLQACATGQHLKEATITFRKAGKGQQDFLIIKMNDVIITGVVQSAPSSEAGSETVSLEFAKVDWEFKPQKADGSLDAGIHFKFDIKANKVG